MEIDANAVHKDLESLRKDIRSLTKAVLTVAAVLAEQGRPLENTDIIGTSDGRRLVEGCHGLVSAQ